MLTCRDRQGSRSHRSATQPNKIFLWEIEASGTICLRGYVIRFSRTFLETDRRLCIARNKGIPHLRLHTLEMALLCQGAESSQTVRRFDHSGQASAIMIPSMCVSRQSSTADRIFEAPAHTLTLHTIT